MELICVDPAMAIQPYIYEMNLLKAYKLHFLGFNATLVFDTNIYLFEKEVWNLKYTPDASLSPKNRTFTLRSNFKVIGHDL